MKQRTAAFTLIETIVVLTVLSVVWLSVTCALYKLHRADRRLRDDLQREQAIDRLGMRLRLDAHAASSAKMQELAAGGDELVLSAAAGQTIHYGPAERGVYRVVRGGETARHRDLFLTGRATSEWELQPPENPALIIVTLTTRGGSAHQSGVRTIKAAVASANPTLVRPGETSP